MAQTNSISVLGERDVYSYTAVAGEIVTIRTATPTSGIDDFIELRDAGSNLLTTAFSKIDRTLTNAGTYLIVVLDQGNNQTGSYGISLHRRVNPCNATSFACGDVAASSLSQLGETDAYALTGVAGERVTVRLTFTNAGAFSPRFDLYDPTGRLLNSVSGTLFTGILTNSGTYALHVSYSSGSSPTGNYWLANEKISAPCSPVILACGTSTNGSLDAIGELDVLTFTATGGEVGALKLTSLTSGFGVTMDVFDATGRALTLADAGTRFGGVLTNAGLCTVVVRYGSGSARTGNYSLFFQNITSPCHSRGTIACGDLGAGFLAPGAAATHSFAGVIGDVVLLRFQTSATPAPSWRLYEPDGTEVTIFDDTLKRTLTKTGNYLLVVFSPSGAPQISDYVVSLNTVRLPCAAVSLVCGATQAGVITEDGEVHAFTFNAVSNEVVLLHVASTSEFFLAEFDLFDPDGAFAWFTGETDLTFTANKTGEHTLLLHWLAGANSGHGEYLLSLHRLSAPCAPGLVTLGTTVSATIAEPEETDLYSIVAGPGDVTICANGASSSIQPYRASVISCWSGKCH